MPSWPIERPHVEVSTHQSALPASPAAHSLGPSAQPAEPPRYAAAIVRRKWFVVFITLLGTALGIISAQFLDPRYSAKALLWIETPARESARDPILDAGGDLVNPPSWVELITSYAVLDEVVRSLHLYVRARDPIDAPAFATFEARKNLRPGRYQLAIDGGGKTAELRLAEGTVIERRPVGDTLGTGAGFAWVLTPAEARAGRRIDFAVEAPYDAAQLLARDLKVRLDPGGSVLRLELKATDPALATATVNAIAERVVTLASDLKRGRFAQLAGILEGQHEAAQQTLRLAEGALASHRQQTAGFLQRSAPAVSSTLDPRGDPMFARAFDLRVSMDQLRRERRTIEQAIRDMPERGVRLDALAVIPSVQQSPEMAAAIAEIARKEAELRTLRQRYTDESQPVQQLKADLEAMQRRNLPALAQKLAGELRSREAAVVPQVDSAFRFLRDVPRLALDEARFERGVRTAEEVAAAIGSRLHAVQLALVSTTPDLRLLDGAVQPGRPAVDFAPLLIALAFFTSLGIAVVLATVLDKLDSKVRTPEQVVHGMRLPILAALPHVSFRLLPSSGQASAEVIEALRSLRVRVLHSLGTEGPLLLTVSSPSQGDGKSFVSVNLALSFAYAGYKTLLIDGDVRRGAQHRTLDALPTPGLTDLLAGRATLDEAIQSTAYPELSFISAGTRMYRAPELLLLPRLRELMANLRSTYGIVIVDSPPLAAGVDPLVLATVTNNLLLVLRSEETDLPLAVAKLEVADSLPVRTIGAVLNCVRGRGAFRYYTYDLSGYAEPSPEELGAGAPKEGWRKVLGGRS
ncbi:MAG: GumC family protein [Gemmatimonadales bacterium]